MGMTPAMQPWDEGPMRRDLLTVFECLPRERLDRLVDLPSVPGCYAQWFATPAVEPVLGSIIATGRYPAYLGVASSSLRERIGRYRQTIRDIASIGERDIYIAVLPCASAASALFAERAGIDELDPPLQGTGWGSKVPGSNRQEQSPVDALFPGRRWAVTPSLLEQARARLLVLSRLIKLDPQGPRWPVLPLSDEREDGLSASRPLATVTQLSGEEREAGRPRQGRSGARRVGWIGPPL